MVVTSWLCAGAGWNFSFLSSAPAVAVLETHFHLLPVIISCTLAIPPILKIFLLCSLMQALSSLSAFWKVFYEEPVKRVVLQSWWRECVGAVLNSANQRPRA